MAVMSADTVDGVGPPDAADSAAAPLAPARRGRRWLAISALMVGLVLVAAVITGLQLGAHYQPVGFGNSGGHLSGRMVTRAVDNFAPMAGQTYLPPQRSASGGLYVSLTNNGPLPVTIESASLNPPYAQGPIDRQAQPLRDTGAATYWPQTRFGSGPGTRLAGSVLRPGEVIVVRLPVTTAGCWMPAHGYSELFTFWVRVRFWRWTHLVQIWWTSPFNQDEGAIIAHEPEPASQGGVCPR
jgi:hypothetical protein